MDRSYYIKTVSVDGDDEEITLIIRKKRARHYERLVFTRTQTSMLMYGLKKLKPVNFVIRRDFEDDH